LETPTTFHERLALALFEDGRDQKELEGLATIGEGQLSRWKRGVTPQMDGLARLLGVLGVSGHWLLTGEGSPELPTGDEAVRLRVIGRIVNGEVDARLLEATDRPGSTQEIADALIDFLRRRASGE
jgi:transcriptional regulator with XRE-family HTH domain